MLFIWSYIHTVSFCISCLVVCSRGLAPCAPFWMTARTRVSSAFARCGTQADGSTVWSAVGSEMRSRPFTGRVAVTSPVGAEMSANSTAGPRPLVRCQTTLLPPGSSLTILLLLSCHQQITPCSIRTGCQFLMCWALLDVPSCPVLDVAAGYSFLILELTGPYWCTFLM